MIPIKNDSERTEAALSAGVVIAGAGPYGEVACRYLKKLGGKVLFFIDNDPEKQGRFIDGIKIVTPQMLTEMESTTVLIAARHAVGSIKKQLDEFGLPSIPFDAFFVAQNLRRIENVRSDLLTDERSRQVYDGIIKAMLSGSEAYCAEIMEGNQYFTLPEFVNIGTDHFVDAGAYVGDTVEKFIWVNNGAFKQIYAFEPGPPQFASLKLRMKRLSEEWAFGPDRFECLCLGLTDSAKEMNLSIDRSSLQGTHFSEQNKKGDTARLISLDDYLAGRPATFIKVDIEGMEMDMLRGAKETIQAFKPKLAISIYHNPEDLFVIPEYVNSLLPEYKMAVRHHSPMLMDSVLYCWIEG